MNNTLFEQFGGTYTQQGDYLLPNLTLPAEEENGYIGVLEHFKLKLPTNRISFRQPYGYIVSLLESL